MEVPAEGAEPRGSSWHQVLPILPWFAWFPPGSSTWLRLQNGPIKPLPGRVQHVPLYPQPPAPNTALPTLLGN